MKLKKIYKIKQKSKSKIKRIKYNKNKYNK